MQLLGKLERRKESHPFSAELSNGQDATNAFLSSHDLIFTYDGDVVLALASYNAGTATRTLVKVDCHAPLVAAGCIGFLVGVVGMFVGGVSLGVVCDL